MTSSEASGTPPPGPSGDVGAAVLDRGAAVLVDALESAPSAIFCLGAGGGEPLWANARARSLGAEAGDLLVVDGRPVGDVVDAVLRTGRTETVCGPLGSSGSTATVVVRPMRVAGGPGALLVLEFDDAAADASIRPGPDVVEQVQLSLLPPSLPLLPDVRLSGSYHRASVEGAAGGDWYDAIALGGGRIALVVGDAVGHGVPAAGAMSRLRGALRSSALRDPSPRALLGALDAFAAEMDDVEGASVCYAVLDAASGHLAYGAAGHPAPLVVHADGRTEFLPVGARPPLGSLPGSVTEVAEHVLEQGATLVLFSNGVVPGAPDVALGRLVQVARDVLAASGALDAESEGNLAGLIAEGVRRPQGWSDDVAVLVAHRSATSLTPFDLELIAVPAALPGIRRQLGTWLQRIGMGEQDRVGVMVAVGEACANAAEHAYRGRDPGLIAVTADVDVDGVLTVTVRDEGSWRPLDRDPGDRGRGLMIMRQLVDTVVLDEAPQGTTVTLRMRLRRAPDEESARSGGISDATVTVDRSGARPVVVASGAVDEAGAEQLRIRLLEASHGGTGRVELDLAAVEMFSSAAVRVVLAIARIARSESWRLVVHAPQGGVTRHVLQISGVDDLVDLR